MRLFALPAALAASIALTAFGTAWLALPQRQAAASVSASIGGPQSRPADASATEPTDAAGWHALGRERAARGLHADALVAFRSAARLRPDDARLLTDYAFSAAVVTFSNDARRIAADEPRRLVERALLIDPNHGEALVLAGTLALDRSDFDAAVQYWERLAQLQPADSAARRQIHASIAQTRRLAVAADRPVELAKAR